jgi:geranylgeranyl reductase family protein
MENKEDKKYAAIVVGAGPSGCSAALFIAKAGHNVLLLDKASFPREKVCGDAFSGKSISIMAELGHLPSIVKFPHGIVRGMTMISPEGKCVSVPFRKAKGMDFAGYTIRRMDLDSILIKAALENEKITVIQDFLVQGLIRDEKGNVVGVEGASSSGHGQKMSFSSQVVVGADGAASAVSRLLGLKPNPLKHVYSAVRGYYSGVEGLTENIELFFIDGVLPGYLWIFPMGNGMANVGLGILSSDVKKHPATVLTDAIANHPSLKSRFKNAALEGKIGGWSIPNGSFRKPCHGNGWVLVGDAASLVDPFSGEGMGNALSSGKFAAIAINAALIKGNGAPLSADSLAGYPLQVDRELRPELENSYRLQQISRFRFILNLFIGKVAKDPKAKKMMEDMFASEAGDKKIESPLRFLRLLLP